jgi:hypothetical protein
MHDSLPFGCKFGHKCFGCVDTLVGTISLNMDTVSYGLSFKAKFGLHSFSASKAHLVDHGEFGAGCVTEDGATTKLLCSEIIPTSQKLMAEKRRFILIREHQVTWLELVQFEDTVGMLDKSGPIL